MAGPCMLSRRNPWRQPWPPSSPATPSRWSGSCGQGQGQPEHGRGGPGKDGSLHSKRYLSSFQLCIWPKSFWFFAFHEERWVDTEFYGGVPPVSQSGLKLTISWEMMMYFAEIFVKGERELCIFYFPPFLEWNRLITHEDNILSIEGFDWNWCLLPPPISLSTRSICHQNVQFFHGAGIYCTFWHINVLSLLPSSQILKIGTKKLKILSASPQIHPQLESLFCFCPEFSSDICISFLDIHYTYLDIFSTPHLRSVTPVQKNFLWKAQKTKDDFQFGVSSSAR